MKKFALIALALCTLAACSGHQNSNESRDEMSGMTTSVVNGKWTIEYGYDKNGCYTGDHVIEAYSEESAVSMFCSNLRDEDGNNHCARGQRDQAYTSHCDERGHHRDFSYNDN